MDDLIVFLAARLDEDEAAARACKHAEWRVEGPPPEAGITGPAGEMLLEGRSGQYTWAHLARPAMHTGYSLHHAARHDPARVLREVAAKRAILDEWEDTSGRRYHLPEGVSEGRDDDERLRDDAVAEAMDTVIAHLAAVYSGHPDYRPEWALSPNS